MTPHYEDTPQKILDVQVDILRKMPPEKKIRLIFEFSEMVKGFARTGLKLRHPNASEEELHRRMASLLLGEELAYKVYGPLKGDE